MVEVASLRYTFNERSKRVETLQQMLGVTVDGWYGRETRAAHETFASNHGIDATVVPAAPTPPPAADPGHGEDLCALSAIQAFAGSVLSPHGISLPQFETGGRRSVYHPGLSLIVLSSCPTKSVVAHELGHYVVDRAVSFSWPAHVSEVAPFAGGGWVKGSELVPGVEHSAHCVGNQLWGYGPYTKCPDDQLAALARDIIDRAS